MNKSSHKTKYLFIALAVLLLTAFLIISTVIFPNSFDRSPDPYKEYFGEYYNELYSEQTPEEQTVGEEIVRRAKACLEYTGTEENAPEKDALSRYCRFGYDKARAEADVSLKKAVIEGNSGSVWLVYTQALYDEKGECIMGSWDVLSRCGMERKNGEWVVTDITEHP